MDSSFRIPNTSIRFGWDSIIGLIPGVGDIITTIISFYIVSKAQRLGVSPWTTARMGLNILIDAALGSMPFVGDVFDLFYKANQRNIRLIEESLASPKAQRRDRIFGILVLFALLVTVMSFIALVALGLLRLIEILF